MRDFMLLARPSPDLARLVGDSFDGIIGELKRSVQRVCPQLQWQADFNLGSGQYVEIFSAPDYESAMKVLRLAKEEKAVCAEVKPLKSAW